MTFRAAGTKLAPMGHSFGRRLAAFAVVGAVLAVAGVPFRSGTAPPSKGVEERLRPAKRQCPEVVPAATAEPAGVARPNTLWTADVEEGTLGDWRSPADKASVAAGGGEFDSGSGQARASHAKAHSGTWAAKLVLADGDGGTRLFRWRELRVLRESVVSVWLVLPRRYTLTADRATGRYWNVFQFKSRSPSGRNDPVWFLNLAEASRGRLRLELIWWHRNLEGPRRGESGFRRFVQTVTDVPVGRWFQLTATLRQSRGFDGTLCVWQGARRLFAKSGIRTSFSNCSYNAWCAANEWSVNNYSDGLSPAPAVIYADDARIAAW